MSQNHNVTKRNRRQISHTRGHEGRATQLALRSPEAKDKAFWQDIEIKTSASLLAAEREERKLAREAKRAGVGK
jgi:hypothetical protein